jgi:anti-anti-sigma regulatory factor
MDSSGIGLIIGRATVCESVDCEVSVVGLSGTQRKLIKLSGVEKIKGITLV